MCVVQDAARLVVLGASQGASLPDNKLSESAIKCDIETLAMEDNQDPLVLLRC